MFFPLGTDRPLRRPTLVNHVLIVANVLIHLGFVVFDQIEPERAGRLFQELWIQRAPGFHWWALITSTFLHGGLMHLLGNMLFLWVFGRNVEDKFGRLGYLLFYLAGGIVASAVHILFDESPAVGASGAIAAVSGAYMVLFPKTLIRCFIFFFYIGVIDIPAVWFIAFHIFWDLFYQAAGSEGIAHGAHLGGYGFGIGLSLTLLWTKVLAREPYDLFSLMRQAHRRRQFKELGQERERALRKHWERAKREDENASPSGSDGVAQARTRVSNLILQDDMDAACDAYRELLDSFGDEKHSVTLNRNAQYKLANHFQARGQHQLAATTYELLLDVYPRDHEAPRIKLLLGLINARYLNDPVQAKHLLREALEGFLSDEERAMANRELESLA